MLRTNIRPEPAIESGDYVYYWSDTERCLGPGRVIRVENNIVHIDHVVGMKTSSINRV